MKIILQLRSQNEFATTLKLQWHNLNYKSNLKQKECHSLFKTNQFSPQIITVWWFEISWIEYTCEITEVARIYHDVILNDAANPGVQWTSDG